MAKERLCRRCEGLLDRPGTGTRYCVKCKDIGKVEQRERARQLYMERRERESSGNGYQVEAEFKEPMHIHGPLLFSQARQDWAWMLVRAYLRNQGIVAG